MSKDISRRQFLKGAAASAAGVAAASILGTSVFADDVDAVTGASTTSTAGGASSGSSDASASHLIQSIADWKVAPDPVSEDLITAEYEAEVLVIGGGYSGAAATLELTEEGYKVICVENQTESGLNLFGGDQGCINSKFCQDFWGAPEVDPVEFYNNWMLNCNNYAQPELVMKFAQHGGDALDWHTSRFTDEEKQSWQVQFWDHNNEEVRPNVLPGIGHFKFWAPTLRPDQSEVNSRNTAYCREQGTEYFFNCHAEQLLTNDDGDVVGAVIYNNETGEYFRVKAEYTIIATGGFGTNKQMMDDMIGDLEYFMQDQDSLSSMGMDRDGSGIAMATWVGARHEVSNVPTMDGRQPWLEGSPGLTAAPGHPQGIFLDYTGKRFCNEFWPAIEHRTFPMLFMNRERMYCIYDNKLPETMEYVVPSHGSTDPAANKLSQTRELMDQAYANKGTATAIGVGERGTYSMNVYAGDTVEECLSYIPDLDERVHDNILESWKTYNEMCAEGKDSQFGRDPEVLFPLDEGPYYVQVVENGNATIANLMVTVGGLWVDGEQRVLGENWKPIKGLFATGNTTSGRFGRDYFTPLMGVSIGMAVCLGREAGISVGKQIRGEIFYL
jgi:succinate dehydrogenase/fumarate reductase flavoprotein subunit